MRSAFCLLFRDWFVFKVRIQHLCQYMNSQGNGVAMIMHCELQRNYKVTVGLWSNKVEQADLYRYPRAFGQIELLLRRLGCYQRGFSLISRRFCGKSLRRIVR